MTEQDARDIIDAAAAIIMADTKGTNDPLVREQADELERDMYRSNVRALTEAGFAVVKLPEPTPREDRAEVGERDA